MNDPYVVITDEDRQRWSCPLPLGYSTFKTEIKMGWDSGDPWGCAIHTMFAVASELWFREPALVPSAWGYSPGMYSDDPRAPDDYEFDICRVASTNALLRFGNMLSRDVEALKRHNKDY